MSGDTQGVGAVVTETPVTLPARIQMLAESADNSGDLNEVTAVLCRARQLITEAGAGKGDTSSSGMREFTCHRVPSRARVVPGWLSALAAVVCLVTDCYWYFGYGCDNGGNPRRSVTFCGGGELPEVSGCLFTLLCRQMWRDLGAWRKVSDRERLKTTATWYRTEDWCCHWTAGIWSALQDTSCLQPRHRNHHLRRFRQLKCTGTVLRGSHPCLFPAGTRHVHI